MSKESRAARFNNSPNTAVGTESNANVIGVTENQFDRLEKERIKKRKQYETNLANAGTEYIFRGTCNDFCPEFERHEREIHSDLSVFEMIPGTETPKHPGDYPRVDHGKAVKKYHRPAAGNEVPLPEDVRTPESLLRTLDYLFTSVIGSLEQFEFSEIHKFIRDRTRSIRQDFTLQNIRDESCVVAHEQIARFHILSGHVLCELDKGMFDSFQNTEQLRKVLQSLYEFYRDKRDEESKLGQVPSKGYPNEPEFMAYYLLTHLRDPDIFRKALSFHPDTFHSVPVQNALEFVLAERQNNYVRFFHLIKSPQTSYLSACLLQQHFLHVRKNAIYAMHSVYTLGQGQQIPLVDLVRILGFEDSEEATDFFRHFGLQITGENDKVGVAFTKEQSIIEPAEPLKLKRADLLVESKNSKSYSEVVRKSVIDPKTVISARINALKPELCDSLFALAYSDNVFASMVKPVVLESISQARAEEEEMKRAMEMEQKVKQRKMELIRQQKLQHQKMIEQVMLDCSSDFMNSIIDSTVSKAVQVVAHMQYQKYQSSLLRDWLKQFCKDQKAIIVSQAVSELSVSIGQDALSMAYSKERSMRKCFFVWRVVTNARLQHSLFLKERAEYIEGNIRGISLKQTVFSGPIGVEDKTHHASTSNYNEILVASIVRLAEQKKTLWKPLNLATILKPYLKPLFLNDPRQTYYRVILASSLKGIQQQRQQGGSRPNSNNNQSFASMWKWLMHKFSVQTDDRLPDQQNPIIQLQYKERMHLNSGSKISGHLDVNIMIQKVLLSRDLLSFQDQLRSFVSGISPDIYVNKIDSVFYIVSECLDEKTLNDGNGFWRQEFEAYQQLEQGLEHQTPITILAFEFRGKNGVCGGSNPGNSNESRKKLASLFGTSESLIQVFVINERANLNCLSIWSGQLEETLVTQVQHPSLILKRPPDSRKSPLIYQYNDLFTSIRGSELMAKFWNDFVCINLVNFLQEQEIILKDAKEGKDGIEHICREELLQECWQESLKLLKSVLGQSILTKRLVSRKGGIRDYLKGIDLLPPCPFRFEKSKDLSGVCLEDICKSPQDYFRDEYDVFSHALNLHAVQLSTQNQHQIISTPTKIIKKNDFGSGTSFTTSTTATSYTTRNEDVIFPILVDVLDIAVTQFQDWVERHCNRARIILQHGWETVRKGKKLRRSSLSVSSSISANVNANVNVNVNSNANVNANANAIISYGSSTISSNSKSEFSPTAPCIEMSSVNLLSSQIKRELEAYQSFEKDLLGIINKGKGITLIDEQQRKKLKHTS